MKSHTTGGYTDQKDTEIPNPTPLGATGHRHDEISNPTPLGATQVTDTVKSQIPHHLGLHRSQTQ